MQRTMMADCPEVDQQIECSLQVDQPLQNLLEAARHGPCDNGNRLCLLPLAEDKELPKS